MKPCNEQKRFVDARVKPAHDAKPENEWIPAFAGMTG
jgi:hypothetical protein